ncbi:hypothetical protein ACI76O_10720 [Capnocytophaga cynodegmi]|uniref:hypothetical protein n=1 Tax=Capnocytophaga cynodegmi TaxID=28189 RepID=UPI001ACE19A2|nr:hypothetical protein [Capnocytophaga cynodegmi]GIM53188.1 hypothetical protein CAPN004_22180 [Capnocytophaga cynodegmi]
MSKNSIKESFREISTRTGEALDSNVSYYKLFAFRFIAKSSYGLINIFLIGLVSLLVLFFLSFAAAFAIGSWLESFALGFLAMGAFYSLVAFIAFIFRKNLIEKPLLNRLSEAYFKSDDEDDYEE